MTIEKSARHVAATAAMVAEYEAVANVPEAMTHMTLDQALRARREGGCTEEAFELYAHAWQVSLGAPRLEIRACDCDECRRNFPSPPYRAL